ncbi:MAG: hypothetical protein IPP72_01910 [Chitinophagaceae bacterium]|nr:hypothetical protein [Chitinophagaceae bacterium]
MKKNRFLLNKYTVTVFILLAYFAGDVFLHKGMSRILFPASFAGERKPDDFLKCEHHLEMKGKNWVKAVNTKERIEKLPADVAGFEMDVYFDTSKNCLLLYHDSAEYSTLHIEAVLDIYQAKKMAGSVWLDFKNLSAANEKLALKYITSIRDQYALRNKMIVESSHPEWLRSFCDSGFFTSYYTPFFNPYQQAEPVLSATIDTITSNLKSFPVSALSGYYFQYPFLKKYFPGFPILTWADDSKCSIVGYCFNKKLQDDPQLKVVLRPFNY